MQSLNEETLMEIAKEIIDNGKLETFEPEEQLHILQVIDAAVRKYIAVENNNTVEEMDKYWTNKKKLSEL
tara:strand:+ start:7644 stop:7853 length:210 start_codon:yes stop_codon:yes gene_type:complete